MLGDDEVTAPLKEPGRGGRKLDDYGRHVAGTDRSCDPLPRYQNPGRRPGEFIGDKEIDLGRRDVEQLASDALHVDGDVLKRSRQRASLQIARRSSVRGEGKVVAIDGGEGVGGERFDGLRRGLDDAVRGEEGSVGVKGRLRLRGIGLRARSLRSAAKSQGE